jgi:hypothetical protein
MDTWGPGERISLEDNALLIKPFTLEGVEETIKELKSNSARG